MGTAEQDQSVLSAETRELGETLKRIMEDDPSGSPTESAASVFAQWLALAGPESREPRCFADVATNYPVQSNSNKDLFGLFSFLIGYLDVEEEPEEEPRRTFIGLPVIGPG
jgi:hypothetical protein